ncbi:MAG: hypothetical protein AD742_10415 [Methylibium sp. NZG]|nr:MAG: hypothetical protein AD742_10415 [Methylibium sp. NZG]
MEPPTTASNITPARLSAGSGHSIVLLDDGQLRAWGDSQPGGGVPVLPATPKAVSVTSGIASRTDWLVTTGTVLLADGTVFAWSRDTPSGDVVTGWGKMRQVLSCGGLGGALSHALADNGRVWRRVTLQPEPGAIDVATLDLARNEESAPCTPLLILGDGSISVVSNSGVTRFTPGLPPMLRARCDDEPQPGLQRYCIGLSQAGHVWTWGTNAHGQLGDGTTVARSTPQRVAALEQVVAVGTVPGQAYALTADGQLFSWGATRWLGRDTTETPASRPGRVDGIPAVREIATGDHVLFRAADGGVWAWGPNARGELGTGDRADRTRPTRVPGVTLN